MENNNWLLVTLIIISILFWRDHHNLKNKLELIQSSFEDIESELSFTDDALEEANSNIEDAKSYAWSSYNDMGYALDNLETVNP